LDRKFRRAADCFESRAIVFHRRIVCEARAHLPENVGGMRVGRFHQAIVNPLAVASRLHDARPAQVGEMTRNFWLIQLQNFDEEADTNLVVSDQINQTQARVIGERLEEKCNVVFFFCHFVA